MREFNIKDIVKVKGVESVLFMVVDYMDFTETSSDGKSKPIDIDYEIMQIYPIRKVSQYATVNQKHLELREKFGTNSYELFMKFITKDRARVGWFDTPDYIRVAEQNLKSINSKSVDDKSVKGVKTPQKLDNIRYDIIDSIDKCLDAINDLNMLHEMFGDEAYLQLKELVMKRLAYLSK